MLKKQPQLLWFMGSFALSFALMSMGHASLSKKAVSPNQVTELKTAKAVTPELESDFSKLSSLESRYAESAQQQQKLRAATVRGAKRNRN